MASAASLAVASYLLLCDRRTRMGVGRKPNERPSNEGEVGHERRPRGYRLVNGLPRGAALGALLVSSVACSGPGSAEPVLSASFEVSATEVPIGSPFEVTFSFSVLSNTVFDEEYRVFLHFLTDDGTLMWATDHDPPRPTTEWRPGSTIDYTRTFLVPPYPYLGDADVNLGLYSKNDGTRLPLAGDHVGQLAYRVGGIRLLPRADSVQLTYSSGWHTQGSDSIGGQRPWSKKVGVIVFDNPRRDSQLYLKLSGVGGWDDGQRTLSVFVGDQLADLVDIVSDELLQAIPLSVSVLGDTNWVELRLEVDRTVVPAELPHLDNPDRRALGVQVLQAFLSPE